MNIDDITDAQLERMTYAQVAKLKGVTVTASAIQRRHNKWPDSSMRHAATAKRGWNPKQPPVNEQAFNRYLVSKMSQGAL